MSNKTEINNTKDKDVGEVLISIRLANWRIEEMTGYKPITTFYMDFSIADVFGEKAILDTFNRAMNERKNEYKYLTELVMVLNWKSWEHYEKGNEELTQLYIDLFHQADVYALDNLKGEEKQYFLSTTD